MPSIITQAGKRAVEAHFEQYAPADPLYEYYTNEAGKQKRRKRQLPPGLSDRDAQILRSVRKRAHYLDKGFSICGLRFGWTFVIGLIPVVGDVADATLNYYLVVRPSRRAEIPSSVLRRMLLNNAFSAGVGLVPFVGDVVLAVFKANSRNAALLEEVLKARGEEFIRNGGVVPDNTKKHRWSRGARNKDAYINITEASDQAQASSSTVQPQMIPQPAFTPRATS